MPRLDVGVNENPDSVAYLFPSEITDVIRVADDNLTMHLNQRGLSKPLDGRVVYEFE